MLTILSDPEGTPPNKKQLTRLLDDARSAMIVLSSTSPEELLSLTARNEAVKQATLFGLAKCGVSNSSGTYPVNADGVMSEEVVSGKEPVAGYRVEYTVMAMP